MNDVPKLISVAQNVYMDLLLHANKMYNFSSEKLDYSFEELLSNTNNYIQSLLFKVAISDNVIRGQELSFLHLISPKEDIFKSCDLENYDNLSDDDKNKILDMVNNILSEVPLIVKLSVVADKLCDDKLIVLKPTNCQIVFDALVRLQYYLKFVDEDVLVCEDIESKSSLSIVVKYYKSKYVKYAPSRSDN